MLIDVAEAALLEPGLHGSGTSVDEMLDKMDARLREEINDPDRPWDESAEAQRAAEAFEAQFPAPAGFFDDGSDR